MAVVAAVLSTASLLLFVAVLLAALLLAMAAITYGAALLVTEVMMGAGALLGRLTRRRISKGGELEAIGLRARRAIDQLADDFVYGRRLSWYQEIAEVSRRYRS